MPSQYEINQILSNIDNYNSYYAGGSLCVDVKENDKSDVLIFNLDETCFFLSGEGEKILLNTPNTKLLFDIYKKYKGDNKYYKESFSKSHIRHLTN